MEQKYLNSFAFRWAFDIAKSPQRVALNILFFAIVCMGGFYYPSLSPSFIALGGAAIPAIFTYCLYRLLVAVMDKLSEGPAVGKPLVNKLLTSCIIDILLQFSLATLILTQTLSAPIFTVILCLVIPLLQILCMRFLLLLYLKG